jgi:predicted phage terminase large subunit-like protein
MSEERRQKLMHWLLNVIMPIGNVDTEFRVIGTIMHSDSMLKNLLENPAWKSYHYEGTNEDLSWFLWPQKYPKDWWVAKKQEYAGFGNLAGFNREYRNIAVDTGSGFFRPEDFRPMAEEDHKLRKTYYVGGDLAFSKKEGRDFTVFVVGGLDEAGILHIVDVRRGRWDGNEVIDQMYSIAEAWEISEWFIESGAIKETLGAALEIRMREEGYLNLASGLVPTKEKSIRAVPIQARMRARGVRFDTESSWFQEFQDELLQFSQEGTRGKHDDSVDAIAWLGQGMKRMVTPISAEEEEDWEFEAMKRQAMSFNYNGRSRVTGY